MIWNIGRLSRPIFFLRGTALAVIGCLIEHRSVRPCNNAALAELAKTHLELPTGATTNFESNPMSVRCSVRVSSKNPLGLNLTVPHKVLALQHVDLEPQQEFVRSMGATNTIKRTENGWYGYNTDGPGLREALRFESGSQNLLQGAHIVILALASCARGRGDVPGRVCFTTNRQPISNVPGRTYKSSPHKDASGTRARRSSRRRF